MADQPHPRPLSVWAVAQQHPRRQRADRYIPASSAHPAKMLPALARHIIATFTRPGDTILDPMCGIGTSCVEAAHLGRHAVGVEYEHRWAGIARRNAALAARRGAAGTIHIITGDARRLPALAPPHLHGAVHLILTSPPYGKATHGTVDADRSRGVHKRDFRYGHGDGNLGHRRLDELLTGFTDILTGATRLLHPDGLVAVTVRPYRHNGELIDLPGAILAVAHHAGLARADRAVALLAGIRGGNLIPRTTFFALHNVRAARTTGVPLHVVAHEDVLLLRRRTSRN